MTENKSQNGAPRSLATEEGRISFTFFSISFDYFNIEKIEIEIKGVSLIFLLFIKLLSRFSPNLIRLAQLGLQLQQQQEEYQHNKKKKKKNP